MTKLEIISAALILCGEKPLTSLDDHRYGAAVGNALYDAVYLNELESRRWRFVQAVEARPAYFELLVTVALAALMIKPITDSDEAHRHMSRHYAVQRNRAIAADKLVKVRKAKRHDA